MNLQTIANHARAAPTTIVALKCRPIDQPSAGSRRLTAKRTRPSSTARTSHARSIALNK